MPLESSIHGRLADYYSLESLINDDLENYPSSYQSNILALDYAVKEKNYEVAGASCLVLFSKLYITKRDTIAFKYLEKARYYYSLSHYEYGPIEVEQMSAYLKFLDAEYMECNNMLLAKLDSYKGIADDVYYHMFAAFMLTSNYIHLKDLKNAHTHYNGFKTLINHPTVVPYNYFSFKSSIDLCFSELFFEEKQLDSTNYYLGESGKLLAYMGEDTKQDYYEINADFFLKNGELNKSKAYLDSLKSFESDMFKNVMDSSFEINNRLLEAKTELMDESEKNYFNVILIGVLFFCLLTISVLYFVIHRRQKLKISDYDNQKNKFSFLKSNHEKLQVKAKGLEDYIGEVKKEVKAISAVDEVNEQRHKIKTLYKNVHLHASTVLSKSESHLDLINDLNVDFFTKISAKFPQLNDSEIIICYYLYTEFKSKEIALFLGTSTRAIESKRYRIRKKLNIQERNMTMFEFLSLTMDTFK